MITCYEAASGIDVLTSTVPFPGFGVVPINAFVLHGPEPVLVDTGPVIEREEFMTALRSVIDPADLRWIWLTHTDFDHIGALPQLLAENPQLRILTTFLSVGIMSLSAPLPLDRVHLINPGQQLTVGDRTLTAVRPPVFDNPATTGFHDDTSGALFSSDCFGALLQAAPENAADLSDHELREGQVFWATLDSPWLHKVDEAALARELRGIRDMEPALVLSSHLPAAPGSMTQRLLASLAAAPAAQPFVGPDQAALEEMLAQMTGPQ
jgi:flavorubredoxin